jgi:hypothetical protein
MTFLKAKGDGLLREASDASRSEALPRQFSNDFWASAQRFY